MGGEVHHGSSERPAKPLVAGGQDDIQRVCLDVDGNGARGLRGVDDHEGIVLVRGRGQAREVESLAPSVFDVRDADDGGVVVDQLEHRSSRGTMSPSPSASLTSQPVCAATRCQGLTVLGKLGAVPTTFESAPGATAQASEPSSSVTLEPTAMSSGSALNSLAAARWRSSSDVAPRRSRGAPGCRCRPRRAANPGSPASRRGTSARCSRRPGKRSCSTLGNLRR